MTEVRYYRDALQMALQEEMERDDRVVVFGEDVGVYGGVFKVTAGLAERFGKERCFDTPISEAGITGMAAGMAILGQRPVVEIMYADFTPLCMDQLVNNVSLLPVAYGGQVRVPMVLRTQGGAGASAAGQHSKSLEAWVAHIPGIKVIMPATPADAKGLLKAAIRDDEPVVCYEHKLLYNTRGAVPDDPNFLIPLGQAEVKRLGTHVTVVATSHMVLEALAAAETLAGEGISVEVVDPRTIKPLDVKTLVDSVRKTHRVLVVHESWRFAGIGAEIAATLAEEAFDFLDAPVTRLAGADTPIPYSPALEPHVIPNRKSIAARLRALTEV